jgi:hypothetical protein
VWREQNWRAWRLIKIEVGAQVSEEAGRFSHIRPWIGPSVGFGVESLTGEEVVLDELGVGVEGQGLVID